MHVAPLHVRLTCRLPTQLVVCLPQMQYSWVQCTWHHSWLGLAVPSPVSFVGQPRGSAVIGYRCHLNGPLVETTIYGVVLTQGPLNRFGSFLLWVANTTIGSVRVAACPHGQDQGPMQTRWSGPRLEMLTNGRDRFRLQGETHWSAMRRLAETATHLSVVLTS